MPPLDITFPFAAPVKGYFHAFVACSHPGKDYSLFLSCSSFPFPWALFPGFQWITATVCTLVDPHHPSCVTWSQLNLLTLNLKTEASSESETPVSTYKTTQWYNGKDLNLNTHHENLKSHKITYLTSSIGSSSQGVMVILP